MGFFDLSDRYASLDAKQDPLVEIDAVVPWEGSLRDRIVAKLALASQLLHQQPKGGDKIYALHEPDVEASPRARRGCAMSSAARSA